MMSSVIVDKEADRVHLRVVGRLRKNLRICRRDAARGGRDDRAPQAAAHDPCFRFYFTNNPEMHQKRLGGLIPLMLEQVFSMSCPAKAGFILSADEDSELRAILRAAIAAWHQGAVGCTMAASNSH